KSLHREGDKCPLRLEAKPSPRLRASASLKTGSDDSVRGGKYPERRGAEPSPRVGKLSLRRPAQIPPKKGGVSAPAWWVAESSPKPGQNAPAEDERGCLLTRGGKCPERRGAGPSPKPGQNASPEGRAQMPPQEGGKVPRKGGA